MGPLWCGQGTVPHTTLSDLLSTDVLVNPPGAPVGAGKEAWIMYWSKIKTMNTFIYSDCSGVD